MAASSLLSKLVAVAAIVVGCTPPTMDPSASAPPWSHLAVQHDELAVLLERYVGIDGAVDYARWKANAADVATLNAYVKDLAAHPPSVFPELFPDEASELAFWLNLYNALVIREIVARWPLTSMNELPASGVAGAGRGLLHDLRFEVGSRSMRLYDIEATIIRLRFKDPRALLAISCGTRSCPVLPSSPLDGVSLDRRLEQAARSFINHANNVTVDDAERRVFLSPILGWYRSDFVALVARRSVHPAPSILDFARMYAQGELAAALSRAEAGRYRVEYKPFDWRIHRVGPPPPPLTTPAERSYVASGEPLPPLRLRTVDGAPIDLAAARGSVVLLDFWATWCKPCLWSFPRYAELALAHEKRGLSIVAVATDEAPEPVAAFAKDNNVGITIAFDVGKVAGAPPLSVITLPTVLLIDRAGVIRFRHEGYEPAGFEALEREIELLLDEPPPQ